MREREGSNDFCHYKRTQTKSYVPSNSEENLLEKANTLNNCNVGEGCRFPSLGTCHSSITTIDTSDRHRYFIDQIHNVIF